MGCIERAKWKIVTFVPNYQGIELMIPGFPAPEKWANFPKGKNFHVQMDPHRAVPDMAMHAG